MDMDGTRKDEDPLTQLREGASQVVGGRMALPYESFLALDLPDLLARLWGTLPGAAGVDPLSIIEYAPEDDLVWVDVGSISGGAS